MLLLVCFAYCFFVIVLGIYLGLEVISVRRGERVIRTMLQAAARAAQASATAKSAELGSTSAGVPNYFSEK